jgi:hypothetical protein
LADSFERKKFKGGGVAIFVRNTIEFETFKIESCTDLDFEIAGIKVNMNTMGKVFILGLYKSPNACNDSFFEKLEHLLNFLYAKQSKFMIMGDINIDVLDHTNHLTQRLRDTLDTFHLIWSVNTPTRVTATSSTAIDNIITNIPNSTVSVINAAISDHFALEAVVTGYMPEKIPPNFKTKRATQPKNIATLNRMLESETWQFLDNFSCVDEMFQAFDCRFNYYLNICCPFKKTKLKQSSQKATWITQGILKSREKLKNLHSIYICTESENFKNFYRNYKRIYRKVIKAAKAYDTEKTLKGCSNFSKSAWKIINSSTKCFNRPKPIQLQINNQTIEKSQEVAEEFNKYFSSVALPDSSFLGPRPLANFNIGGQVSSMALSPVSERDVARVIEGLKPKQSTDINGMSVWLLKRCYRHILKPLTKLVNFSFQTGSFPSSLKISKVIPIFKKDDRSLPSNYRPISIPPVLSKVFEKLFLENLVNFLERFEIISKDQFGFQKCKSTIDAVTKFVETVVDGLERREHVLSIFLDLSKAFDCVHHATLLHQLDAYGIRGLPQRWIASYLNGRSQCVQIEDAISQKEEMVQGVPQGSILGPILFLLYVNQTGSSILNGEVIQYADDTTICVKSQSKQELEIKSFIDLNSCIQMFSEINLRTNNSKTKVIEFCLRQRESNLPLAVMVDEDLLEETDSTKFLGMHIDKGLTWEDHVDYVCARVSSGIFALRNLSKFCSQEVLLMAYFGLIYPHISYGICIWGGCANHRLERVFRLQKKAVRVISKLKPRESCRNAFRELGVLTLPCLYIFEVAVYCKYKCSLVQNGDFHSYYTRGRANLRVQQHRTVAFEHLPSQFGIKILNKLPEGVKHAQNQNQFKTRLKSLLVSNVLYSVEEFMMCRWDNQIIGVNAY